jgi:hypothetical protein
MTCEAAMLDRVAHTPMMIDVAKRMLQIQVTNAVVSREERILTTIAVAKQMDGQSCVADWRLGVFRSFAYSRTGC